MDEFLRNIITINTFGWLVLSALITAMFGVALEVHEKPNGYKIGFICAIAFFIGTASVRMPFFS